MGIPTALRLLPDGTYHVLELRRAGEPVDLVADVDGGERLRIEEVELELGADPGLVAHRLRAGHLLLEHAPGIDRHRLVVHAERAPEAERASFLPGQGVDRAAGEQVHVGVAVSHVDVGRVPHVAGHVDGEQGDRQRVARAADPGPLVRGHALAPQDPVEVADAEGNGMGPFRQHRNCFRPHVLLLHAGCPNRY